MQFYSKQLLLLFSCIMPFSLSAMYKRIEKLIEKEEYSAELAQKLDLFFTRDGYEYKGDGIYQFNPKDPSMPSSRMHSLPRHLCEPGVSKEEAEIAHKRMAPAYANHTQKLLESCRLDVYQPQIYTTPAFKNLLEKYGHKAENKD